jgi:four helix bundle protein
VTVKRFEDLVCWQEARELTRAVCSLCGERPLAQDFGLGNQVRRAAISIMANIAEGFSRHGDREFIQFLFIAKSSASELQSHLYVILDQAYMPTKDFDALYAQAERIQKQISNLIKYLRSSTRKHGHQPMPSSTTQQTQQTQQTQ